MNIEKNIITVAGIQVEVVRKNIKNLHLGVYPPHGRVRVAAPMVVSDEAVRLAVLDKLAWIKRQKVKFDEQPRQSPREMVSGESHYYLGRRYRLRVHEGTEPERVQLKGIRFLDLFVTPGSNRQHREVLLNRWYRRQFKILMPNLLEKWQGLLNVEVSSWHIKQMKTKWGSCNPGARRVWFNLELIKNPLHCLEYVAVHELAHLREKSHNEQFIAILDRHLPRWREIRTELQNSLLAYQSWEK